MTEMHTLQWTVTLSTFTDHLGLLTNVDLLEQEIVSGSGISWAICKSAPRLRQITTPASPLRFHKVDALPAAQPTASKHWRQTVMSMYTGAKTVVRTVYCNSNCFDDKVGMHQGSALSPLLFVIVMKALSGEFSYLTMGVLERGWLGCDSRNWRWSN